MWKPDFRALVLVQGVQNQTVGVEYKAFCPVLWRRREGKDAVLPLSLLRAIRPHVIERRTLSVFSKHITIDRVSLCKLGC